MDSASVDADEAFQQLMNNVHEIKTHLIAIEARLEKESKATAKELQEVKDLLKTLASRGTEDALDKATKVQCTRHKYL